MKTRLPKPRVTPRLGQHRIWDIDFGGGAVATITEPWDIRRGEWMSEYTWSVTLADGTERSGVSHSGSLAFDNAWAFAATVHAPPPVSLSFDEIAGLAAAAEESATGATKAFRTLLRLRTGFAWSSRVVKHSTWLRLSSAPKRCDGPIMTSHDRALLSACLAPDWGLIGGQGLGVRPCKGARADMVWRLAGVERLSRNETADAAVDQA